MTLDELVSRCKAGVFVRANEHRTYCESVARWVAGKTSPPYGPDEVDKETAARMAALDTAVEIQFYPLSSVGFYSVYGVTVQECLDRAESVLKTIGR